MYYRKHKDVGNRGFLFNTADTTKCFCKATKAFVSPFSLRVLNVVEDTSAPSLNGRGPMIIKCPKR